MQELNEKIIKWAKDRGIDKKGTVEAQSIKTIEEIGELIKGICKDDMDLIKDSIGDVYVTLVVGSLIANGKKETLAIFKKNEREWNEYEREEDPDIKNWCGDEEKEWIKDLLFEASEKILRENFKYGYYQINGLRNSLYCYAVRRNTTLKECVELAYKEIAGRKGKMIDGQFVKEADLG